LQIFCSYSFWDSFVILTVNNRLARELRQQFDRQQASKDQTVWQSAVILPWSAWLQQSYESLVDQGLTSRVLLQNHHEAWLWQQIVQADERVWLRPQAAAQMAQQAWQLLLAWRLDLVQVQAMGSDETACFLAWQAAFRRACTEQGLLSLAELPDILREHGSALCLPNHISLCGFDDLSPQQQALFDQLGTQGISIERFPDSDCDSRVRAVQADCAQDEIRAAATWAKQQLLADPTCRIAVISPQLQQQRQALEHGFREVICPQSLLPGGATEAGFNLSLGRPLADYPLVTQLLLAFDLTRNRPVPLAVLSVLLRSPFIGIPDEWQQRAAFDRRLHDEGLPELSVARFVRRARVLGSQDMTVHMPDFIARLTQLRQQAALWPQLATPVVWAEHLWSLMCCLGWPGPMEHLNSAEFQQVTRFRRILSDLASLALVQIEMRWSEALAALRQLCASCIFQAKSTDHQLHILGILDAVGLQFDAVWLLNMDDRCWPPAANPHPLLPVVLQRDLAMPHASNARELAFAQQLCSRLRRMAPEVIVSYATQMDDRAQNMSPLFADVPMVDLQALSIHLYSELHSLASLPGPLDTLPAPEAIPPLVLPGGGSHLLNAQAACPFQAVARFRLGVRVWPELSFAPDARLNGSILHTILQQVWEQLQDSAQLQAYAEDDLSALVVEKAEQTLREFAVQRPDIFSEPFIALESARLVNLVLSWLELEKQRSTPFRVSHLEERRDVVLQGLPLHLQTDRVDILATGEQVVIDYKSGQLRQPDWAGDRPTELQVPLYCIQADRPVAGLLGQVNGQRTLFRGMADYADIAPGIPAFQATESVPNWSGLLDHWQQVLAALSSEIQAGQAEIAPRDAQACERCGLQSLCRIGVTAE
jgi:probable DNA repair protein